MIKIVTIIGARPQIIKAAALSRAIKNKFSSQITEVIVHTGQHYDNNMSQVFFDELGIPAPNYNLNVGSGSHGTQTATMITGIEEILEKEKPNCIVLYGDTNSTLAGGIAASKIHVPVVHIEAGLRSKNKAMPEEINRIMCDHVSTLLFSPTQVGYTNLVKEGFSTEIKEKANADNPNIFHCGDIMYDNSLFFAEISEKKTTILEQNNLKPNQFILSTIHRNNNTDEPNRLTAIFTALNKIATENNIKIVLPLHPRTAKLLEQNLSKELYNNVKNNSNFIILPPASFLEMIALEKNSKIIITDSGGVQKEAFFFKKPCVILRSETEWIELLECGSAILADANEQKIMDAYTKLTNNTNLKYPSYFGDGNSAEFMCQQIITNFI